MDGQEKWNDDTKHTGAADKTEGSEQGPPASFEQRRTIEARQPELTELELSDEELKALGFTPPTQPIQPT